MTTHHLFMAQQTIEGGKWRENSQAKEWAGVPIAKALGLGLTTKAEKARIRQMLKIWIENGAFKVVEDTTDARQSKKFIEVGKWADKPPEKHQ
jgi:hypothetical protein